MYVNDTNLCSLKAPLTMKNSTKNCFFMHLEVFITERKSANINPTAITLKKDKIH